jgi:hypothetical protein
MISLRDLRPVKVNDLVRIGKHNDGGYVISRSCLERTRLLVSAGISSDWSFEEEFVQRNPEAAVLSLDRSVSHAVFRAKSRSNAKHALASIATLSGRRAVTHYSAARFFARAAKRFERFFDGRTRHFVPKWLSNRVDDEHTTVDRLFTDYVDAIDQGKPLKIFVKLDIERSEYRTLPALSKHASRINGLVVEFHELDILWDKFREAIDCLANDFAIVHMHGNNHRGLIPDTGVPMVMETTFVNRRLLPQELPASRESYPIKGLDQPNDPTRDDIPLNFDG